MYLFIFIFSKSEIICEPQSSSACVWGPRACLAHCGLSGHCRAAGLLPRWRVLGAAEDKAPPPHITLLRIHSGLTLNLDESKNLGE